MASRSSFPELPQPNNPEAVRQTFAAYRQTLAAMSPAQLMAHLTDINARLEMEQRDLAARAIQAPLSAYVSQLDHLSLRSMPTAAQPSAAPRDRGLPPSPRPELLNPRSSQARLGRMLAGQLVRAASPKE